MAEQTSFIPAEKKLPEITIKVIVISIVLSMVLAISNAYLALKVGFLLSASIPAAIISMGILRFFKNSNVLENNLVQTAASAGEAVAGGIVYTIPAMVIVHEWTSFSYWQNFFIALTGGVLGVMFSIPLRRILMTSQELKFPEGRAIAEVLKLSSHSALGVRQVIYGGIVGALLEFFQTGIKIFSDTFQYWIKIKKTVIGFGIGFSPAMIGAGYLIGFELTASIFLGAVISWFLLVPLFGYLYPELMTGVSSANDMAHAVWSSKIRYVGIGAMLVAGLMTLGGLLQPIMSSIRLSLHAFRYMGNKQDFIRTDRDIPLIYVAVVSLIFIAGLFFLYQYLFPVEQLKLSPAWTHSLVFAVLCYTVVMGFIFCAVTAYFSGMVGVSASPGSSVIIAGLLIIAAGQFFLLYLHGYSIFTPEQIKACQAITIICTAVITGMAAISNDNMQDLKVGYLLGATPWKQQVMLLLGVVCASLIITPVMQMLYGLYGIAGVMPHSGMDVSKSLPAPPAAVMATLSQAVFQQQIPWNMLGLGAVIPILLSVFNRFLSPWKMVLSILGIAIGVYLPLVTSTSLFLGGLIAKIFKNQQNISHQDTMLACGLIAGTALLDVVIAVPLSFMPDPNVINLSGLLSEVSRVGLSIIFMVALCLWFRQLNKNK